MPSRPRVFVASFGLFCALIGLAARFPRTVSSVVPGGEAIMQKAKGQATISDRLNEFGERADARWQPFFERTGVPYPPAKVVLLGFKQEKRLEIYARSGQEWRFIRALPILRASGKSGPKLREGDRQVPEGFYPIESLNPNSSFHVSLRIGYPSASDREIAAREGRTDLGGDIMIHGGAASIGCLAMGDEAAEDLFVLAAKSGRENIEIVLCPLDFRVSEAPDDPHQPAWIEKRYARLRQFVQTLPRESR